MLIRAVSFELDSIFIDVQIFYLALLLTSVLLDCLISSSVLIVVVK